MQNIVSIRGAITVKKNDVKEIKDSTIKLLDEVFKQNNIQKENIINIIFTVTDDLDTSNPATITRKKFNIDSIPMLCVQEMKLKDGLPMCIRLMMQTYSSLKKEQINHIYLENAITLRPDLNP